MEHLRAWQQENVTLVRKVNKKLSGGGHEEWLSVEMTRGTPGSRSCRCRDALLLLLARRFKTGMRFLGISSGSNGIPLGGLVIGIFGCFAFWGIVFLLCCLFRSQYLGRHRTDLRAGDRQFRVDGFAGAFREPGH